MLAACVALLGALSLLATHRVLPSMLRDRVLDELRRAGFPEAELHLARVGIDSVVLTDVHLEPDLAIERVEATLDWTSAHIDAVDVHGLTWSVDARTEAVRESALAKLLRREGSGASDHAPIVRLSDARVIVREGPQRWTIRANGAIDPSDRTAALTLHTEALGEVAVDARFDDTVAGETSMEATLRSIERGDLVQAHVVLTDAERVAIVASAQLRGGQRWRGIHVGDARVRLRTTIERGRIDALTLDGESEAASSGELVLQHARVSATREGERIAWSASVRSKDGLEAHAGGALPRELARMEEALRDGIAWELAGPVPAVFLERRVNGIDFVEDPRLILRGRARLTHGDGWALERMRGSIAISELRVPSANARLEDVQVALNAHGVVHASTVSVTIEPGSRLSAARAHLEEVHATRLETSPRLGVLVDDEGVQVRMHAPFDVSTETFAVGESRSALRFLGARFALREHRRRALVDARHDGMRIAFGLRARAPSLRGVLHGRGIDASGSLDVDVRPDGARIDLPLALRAEHLEQRDSEAELEQASVTLPLRWANDTLRANGRMEAQSIAWRDTLIGPTEGDVRIGARMLRLAWTGPATDRTSFRLDAELAMNGSERGTIDVEVPASDVRAGDPVQRVLATLTDLRIEGRAEGEVHVELGAPERGHARLVLTRAKVEEVEGAGKARDVNGTLRFRGLDPLIGSADAPWTWSELELGDVVRLGPGSAGLRFVAKDDGEGSEIEITAMRAAAAGGQIRLAPFRFDLDDPTVDLDVTVDGVELRRIVRALTEGRASATGHVDGRVSFRVHLGDRRRVVLGRGRLAARGPGRILVGDGRLEPLDEARLATLIQGEWIQRRVLAALADFEYRRFVLLLDDRQGTSRVRAHVLGRGRRMPQELDLTLNVRGVQPLLDQALRLWPTQAVTAWLGDRSS